MDVFRYDVVFSSEGRRTLRLASQRESDCPAGKIFPLFGRAPFPRRSGPAQPATTGSRRYSWKPRPALRPIRPEATIRFSNGGGAYSARLNSS
jgi:hypothetical protein